MPESIDLTSLNGPRTDDVLSVSALNRNVRDLLEHRIPLIWVGGEISNLSTPRSGHWYFSLKDDSAQVRCVMFRNRGMMLDWQPRDGMHIEARALVTLYEARGEFQLNVEFMRQAGQGALYEAFLRLRDRLSGEGLFDPILKRSLPPYPRNIGVITSLQAAALRDVLTTLARRNPSIRVVIYPAAVQGYDAPAQLLAALAAANRRREVDVLILCRGGGSLEDLCAFNDETLARAIRASAIPLISGVGHETDFSIADFAADLRAPTPTAAAEIVSTPRAELLARIARHTQCLQRCVSRALEVRMQHVDHLSRRLLHPARRLTAQRELLAQYGLRLQRAQAARQREHVLRLRDLEQRLRTAATAQFQRRRIALASCGRALTHLDPRAVLERGYSIVRDDGGHVVRAARVLTAGQTLSIDFAAGGATARVEKIRSE